MRLGGLGLLAAVLCALCAPAVHAQAANHGANDHESASGESASSQESEQEAHKNVLALFAGVTHDGRRNNGAALGVAYERLLTESFGIGVIAEHTFGDADFTVYMLAFGVRIDRWKLYVAPGVEDSDEHGTEPLVRLGAEYALVAGTWEISPQVAVDFVEGDEVLVLGFVFTRGF